MSRKFKDGLERGRDGWRERTSVLTATPTPARGDVPAPVTLHWTRHPDAVGYHIYRIETAARRARPKRINARRPIAPATTCAQFCAFVPKKSDLWDRLCDGLSALSATEKAEVEADQKGLARFKDDLAAARVTSRAIEPLTGRFLRDPLPDAIDPCEALERGLTKEETALFDALAHVDLRMRQARGLAFIDKTARAGTEYAYSLVGIDRTGKEFLLAESDGADRIALTQRDIRELQLATGAIRAGVKILLDRAELAASDLDQVLIAGGFGSFIRRSKAQRIGLLPGEVDHRRITYVGNASLNGAKWALLSTDIRRHAEQVARHTHHVQLSEDMNFQMEFAEAMIFPE